MFAICISLLEIRRPNCRPNERPNRAHIRPQEATVAVNRFSECFYSPEESGLESFYIWTRGLYMLLVFLGRPFHFDGASVKWLERVCGQRTRVELEEEGRVPSVCLAACCSPSARRSACMVHLFHLCLYFQFISCKLVNILMPEINACARIQSPLLSLFLFENYFI